MCILGLLRSGVVLGIADRPDRLVGDADTAQGVFCTFASPSPSWRSSSASVWFALRCSSVSPTHRITSSPAARATLYFLVDERVGFAQFVPALAVSQDDVLAAEIKEHRWANLAGECAFLFGIHVLCPERDAAALQDISNKREIRERRTENDRDAFLVPQSINDVSGQLPGIGGGGVHLPVADNGLLLHAVHHHEAHRVDQGRKFRQRAWAMVVLQRGIVLAQPCRTIAPRSVIEGLLSRHHISPDRHAISARPAPGWRDRTKTPAPKAVVT